MIDDRGRSVNQPLLLGARHCGLHLQLFCTKPISITDSLLIFLDFETSGLDVVGHHIVEIALLCENSACFSTVVCPPVFSDEMAVHGIANEELNAGPQFAEAFHRMCSF